MSGFDREYSRSFITVAVAPLNSGELNPNMKYPTQGKVGLYDFIRAVFRKIVYACRNPHESRLTEGLNENEFLRYTILRKIRFRV